jgi:hypothetical protein
MVEWLTGDTVPDPRGSVEQADQARLGAARVVRHAAVRDACPAPPLYEVGPRRAPPAPDRLKLTQDGQWLAYLLDYLGLWPDTDRNPKPRASVRGVGPMDERPRRTRE